MWLRFSVCLVVLATALALTPSPRVHAQSDPDAFGDFSWIEAQMEASRLWMEEKNREARQSFDETSAEYRRQFAEWDPMNTDTYRFYLETMQTVDIRWRPLSVYYRAPGELVVEGIFTNFGFGTGVISEVVLEVFASERFGAALDELTPLASGVFAMAKDPLIVSPGPAAVYRFVLHNVPALSLNSWHTRVQLQLQ